MEESPRDMGKTQTRVLGEFLCSAVAHRVGSLCFMPFVVIQKWKNKNILPEPKRRVPHLYPYSSFVREGKTKPIPLLCQAGENQRSGCIAISTWVLENLFILYSNSFPLFALNVSDLFLALGCGADPTGAPAVNPADNWSRLVLS